MSCIPEYVYVDCCPLSDEPLLSVAYGPPPGASSGRLLLWLLRRETIEAIEGLFSTSSWTHSKPMWMHLVTSTAENLPAIVWSRNARGSFAFHSLRACKYLTKTNKL